MELYNYDVFISFKNSDENGNQTKDSHLAEELYDYLSNSGLRVFFSKRELEFIGKAQYTRVIDAALDSSNFLIAVGCSNQHLESQWVRYEWESFIDDIRSNIKPNAEVFVLYQDMARNELPRALRRQQAFDASSEDCYQKILNYINSARNIMGNTSQPALTSPSAPVSPVVQAANETPIITAESHAPATQDGMSIASEILTGKKNDLMFGGYKWRVLAIENDCALIITEDIIEKREYNTAYANITWPESSLRKYLNVDFLQKFSQAEQDRMVVTNVCTTAFISTPPPYGIDASGTENTEDKIFLLTQQEADRYLGSDGVKANFDGKPWWWWLRAPGEKYTRTQNVTLDGKISVDGNPGFYTSGGVRPVMWLSLEDVPPLPWEFSVPSAGMFAPPNKVINEIVASPFTGEKADFYKDKFYEGEWKDGVPHGHGILYSSVGNMYTGSFVNGVFHGRGTRIWGNGDSFEGEWQNNERNGIGKITWLDGEWYEGEWRDDKRTGKGVYHWPSGNTYTGDFVDGTRIGKGVYKWVSGASYDGDFVDNKRTGIGTYTYPNGNVYIGEHKEGKFHGKGRMEWTSGGWYEGDWVDDKRTGKGIQYGINKSNVSWTYTGGYVNSKWSGEGKISWSDGASYEGEWQDDKRTGKGKYIYANGGVHDGMWKDGNKDGYGVYTYSDGTVQEGVWHNGSYVGQGAQ